MLAIDSELSATRTQPASARESSPTISVRLRAPSPNRQGLDSAQVVDSRKPRLHRCRRGFQSCMPSPSVFAAKRGFWQEPFDDDHIRSSRHCGGLVLRIA